MQTLTCQFIWKHRTRESRKKTLLKTNPSANETREGLDILYVGTLPPHNGGSAIVGYQLVAGLAKLGHGVRAISPITIETLDARENFSRRHPEIRISSYVVPFFTLSSDQPMSADHKSAENAAIARAFDAAISERHPDALILGRETFVWQLPDLARSRRIPSMLIVQSGHSFERADSSSHRAQRAEQFRRVDLVVAVASHQQEMMQKVGLPSPLTIPNPVDLAKFCPAPKGASLMERLGISSDSFVIAHISNLKAIKRASDLVASAREVVRLEPRATYVMVGDGPCREQLEAECRTLGIADHFRFTGWVDHEKVAEYINLADTVVMPSEVEAMALVYLETQACGRCLIASDIPAACEAVREGETGLLFRMGDTADLTRKILLAASDPALRERIGSAARESVKAHDRERFVAAYDRAIRGLVRKLRAAL